MVVSVAIKQTVSSKFKARYRGSGRGWRKIEYRLSWSYPYTAIQIEKTKRLDDPTKA